MMVEDIVLEEADDNMEEGVDAGGDVEAGVKVDGDVDVDVSGSAKPDCSVDSDVDEEVGFVSEMKIGSGWMVSPSIGPELDIRVLCFDL